jgi:hypothetical protein
MNLAWLENLTKPFSSLLNPLAERIGRRLGNRKPNLFVHFDPTQQVWGISMNGDHEMRSFNFFADFNHDDPRQTLAILDAYPEGTISQVALMHKFHIPPGAIITQRISVFVSPPRVEKGEPWTGKIVFVDQFKRKYKSEKVTARWLGPLELKPMSANKSEQKEAPK